MLRITLSAEERATLEREYKTTDDQRLRARCQAVLMADRKRPRKQIAEDVGTTPRTILRWLREWEAGGLDGLRIQWGPGGRPAIPETLGEEIVGWVKGGPSSCGLDRANWTYEELAYQLQRAHSIKVGATTMRQFCSRRGVRLYRPTYRFLRGDAEKQQKAVNKLRKVRKRRGAWQGRAAQPG
jgi:transposase